VSRRREPPPPRSPFITPEGAARLHAEYRRLRSVERPRVTREVAAAAAQGDRSENAEYIYGKKRLREIDARLEFLTRRLDALQVVTPSDPGDGVVRFGACVELLGSDGAEVVYQIVGPDEFDVSAGRISMDSPVGRALLGSREGDTVRVARPSGPISFEILTVRYGG